VPLKKGTSKATVESNFDEFRHGKTFAHTARKFGVAKARKQMIAAVLTQKRKSAGQIYREAKRK
jgi:hypothetical protein